MKKRGRMKRIRREKEEEKETKNKRRKMKMKKTVLSQVKQTLPNEIITAARITTDFATK
jgi:hypothetical protein